MPIMPLLNKIREALFFVLLLIFSSFTFAGGDTHLRSWNTAIIQGPLSKDQKIRYFLQPQIGFEDNHYKFQRAFQFVGAGYQFLPPGIIWLMVGAYYNKHNNGKQEHVYVLRQQLNWLLWQEESVLFSSTSRLEERKETQNSALSLKVRQMFTVRATIPHFPRHSIVLFDEMFFNLNYPKWINSNTFFEQNRAFIGIGTQFSKATSIDFGYLNQYLVHHEPQRNNIIYLALNVIH